MPAHEGAQFFPHVMNPVINGGTFIGVTSLSNSKVDGEHPMRHIRIISRVLISFQILLNNVSKGALHNAAQQGDTLKCLPRTRTAIRAEIMQWITAPSSMRKLILWIYGPAGSGKTSIAHSIAEECERLRLPTISFFFWRQTAGRNDTSQFVSTLAYQLSRHIPPMNDHLIAAIEKNPIIFSSSLSHQMRVLVIEPLKLAAPSLSAPMVAIVDGVDECGPDGKSQHELLDVLGSIASELSLLSLVFLVSSRPEYEIRKAFNSKCLSPLTKVLVLDNKYKPDKDIKLYFESKFREISDENLREVGYRLSSPWPAPRDVNFLTLKASGQFIFASTVIKFVGSESPRSNPEDRLKIVMSLSPAEDETPFAPLDRLYCFILESVAVSDIEKVRDILVLLLLPRNYTITFSKAEVLLGFNIRRALIDMHALLSVPPPSISDSELPGIHHASFPDFLMDQRRSLEHYIDINHGHAKLARCWLKIIGSCPNDPEDAINGFIYHCNKLHSLQAVSQKVVVVDDLAYFDLEGPLRALDFKYDLHVPMWQRFMECGVQRLTGGQGDAFIRLQKHFDTFILDYIGRYQPLLQPYVAIQLDGPHGCGDIFGAVLHAISTSADEFNDFRTRDKELLNLCSNWVESRYMVNLFQDPTRSGTHFLDDGRYGAFAKMMVNLFCINPRERNYEIMLQIINRRLPFYLENGSNPAVQIVLADPNLSMFHGILDRTPTDLGLADLLIEYAVQYSNYAGPVCGRWTIAQASIDYIQRCGISFLEHAHRPDTDACAICSWCRGAVVKSS